MTSLYAPEITVEVAFDSGVRTPKASRTWIDISDYVELSDGISINGGRSDERSVADANGCTVVVDNSDGRFTPLKAAGAYYPDVKLHRPIRVRAKFPPTPSTNLFSLANADFESGVGSWTAGGTVPPTLSQSSTHAYRGTYSLRIAWGTGGTFPLAQCTVSGLTAAVQYTVGIWVRVPAGDPAVKIAIGGGIGVISSVSNVNDTWQRLEGTFTATGASHNVQIWPHTSPTAGDFAYIDAAMVVEGSTIGTFNTVTQTTWTRFEGYVDEWPLEWSDGVDSYAKSTIVASSRLARLGQSTEMLSVIQAETLALAPVSYYRLGEPDGAPRAADSSGNSADPLVVTGSGAGVTFGQAGIGTDGGTAAAFTGKKYLKDSYSATGGSGVTLSLFYKADDYLNGAINELVSAIGVYVGIATGGTVIASVSTGANIQAGAMPDNTWHHLAARLNAGGTTVSVWVDGVNLGNQAVTGHTPSATALVVGDNTGITCTAFTVAHVAVFDTALADADIELIAEAGLTGFTEETADVRLARFASYAGVAAAETDFDAGATTLIAHVNPAGQTNLEPMRTVEETEGGVLFDARDNTLTYIGRAARPSATAAATLSMLDHEVEAGVTPRYDRGGLVNDATATLVDGSSFQATDSTSIDDYDPAKVSVDLASTDPVEAASAATWRVSTYSQPQLRIPNLSVELVHLSLEQAAALFAVEVGDLVTVDDWPSQSAETSQSFFVEGYADQVGLERYGITFNVSPADLWLDTFILDSGSRGVLDTNRLAY